MRTFAALLLSFRLAVLPAEAAAPLKLLEKGVSKEALAGLVRPRSPVDYKGFVGGRVSERNLP